MKSRSCGNGSGEAVGPAAEMISVDSWKGGHMGEKDMAEKLLEDYPDADFLLMNGKRIMIKRKRFEQFIDRAEMI